MKILISARPDSEQRSLQEWLGHEGGLRGRVAPIGRGAVDGQLGEVVDLLSVAVGTGGAVSVLAASLRAWLQQPRRSDVRVVVRNADGSEVEVDAKRVVDVEGVLRQALRRGDGPDDEAS